MKSTIKKISMALIAITAFTGAQSTFAAPKKTQVSNEKPASVKTEIETSLSPDISKDTVNAVSKELPKVKASEINMDCVIKTVESREDSVAVSVKAFALSVDTAIMAHKTDLVNALRKLDAKERTSLRKSANSAYKTSMKKAKGDFEVARKKTMVDFKNTIKTCGKGADRAADLNETPFVPGSL